ncbi:MAG: acetate--CoA ligase family protein, partial [Paracoccus sp. (in: a-proteobacteria)]|nr:acetate--CoA ligase family protein [Paracoccus sp. (in: a-proteobacteria)]
PNLPDAGAVGRAAAAMNAPGFLIEEMVTGTVAELLIGVIRDPHGWLLTLAAGGTATEIWRDSQSLLLPVTEADVLSALDRLRLAPLLHGWRGAPGADPAAIVRAVLAVQDYVAATPDLAEVEVNPLLCGPAGAVAVDALIRKETQ